MFSLIKTSINLIMLIGICSLPTYAQTYRSAIKGRVVDETGKPVIGASIHPELPKEAENSEDTEDRICGAKIGVVSGKDGKFSVKEDCSISIRSINLFVTYGVAEAVALLSPPFGGLREKNSLFAGQEIIIRENSDIDLGDVQVQLWYGEIELTVLDNNGKPYYKNFDDWNKFVLKIRDKNGQLLASGSLSTGDKQKAVNVEKSSVKLALPEGIWSLELLSGWDSIESWDDFENKIPIATTEKFTIRKCNAKLPLRLSFQLKGNSNSVH